MGAFTLRHLRPIDTLAPWRTFTKHALVSPAVLLWVSVRKAAEYLTVLVPVVSHKSSWALAFTSFFYILLILCEFYIMHSKPTYFPVPCFCNTPHKEKKKKPLQWELQCVSVSHSTPFVHTSFHADVHCHELLVWFRPLSPTSSRLHF